MRFTTSTFVALAAAPLLAAAQDSNGPNPFNISPDGLDTEAGSTFDIEWEPTTSGTVTLLLRAGDSEALDEGQAIATNIDNTGSYSWQVPDSILRGSDYALEIVDDDNEENTNFTPQFAIESDNDAPPASEEDDEEETASATDSASASETSDVASETSDVASETSDIASQTTEAPSASETSSENPLSTVSSDDLSSMLANTMSESTTMATSTSADSSSMTSSTASPTSTDDSDDEDAQNVVEQTDDSAAGKVTAMVGVVGAIVLGAFAL